MQSAPAGEARLIKRRHLFFHLRVFNRLTGEQLGHVVDISSDGLMLVSETVIPTDVDFQLLMKLPDEGNHTKCHEFEARSVWSSNDADPHIYDTGFRVIEVSKQYLDMVQYLVDNYDCVLL